MPCAFCVHMHAHIYIYTHVCTCKRVQSHLHVCACTHLHAHLHALTHAHACTHMHVHKNLRTHTHLHPHGHVASSAVPGTGTCTSGENGCRHLSSVSPCSSPAPASCVTSLTLPVPAWPATACVHACPINGALAVPNMKRV